MGVLLEFDLTMATVFAAVAAFVGMHASDGTTRSPGPRGSTTACDVFDIQDHSQNRINIGKKEKTSINVLSLSLCHSVTEEGTMNVSKQFTRRLVL